MTGEAPSTVRGVGIGIWHTRRSSAELVAELNLSKVPQPRCLMYSYWPGSSTTSEYGGPPYRPGVAHPSADRLFGLGEITGVEMTASVLYMSMSLDGYIAGPNDQPGNPGGDGFLRLHEWFLSDGHIRRPSGPAGELFD